MQADLVDHPAEMIKASHFFSWAAKWWIDHIGVCEELMRRAWKSATRWKMVNIGTKKVGMSTSGKCLIGAAAVICGVTVCARRTKKSGAIAPMPMAKTAKSKMPKIFQATKVLLAAKRGFWLSATTTHGAVRPIAMSPRPAGHAK